jgi:uncharacterized membrane protein YGL010W
MLRDFSYTLASTGKKHRSSSILVVFFFSSAASQYESSIYPPLCQEIQHPLSVEGMTSYNATPATTGLVLAHALTAVVSMLTARAALEFGSSVLETMAFYGVYHAHPWNQVIHFFFVPVLLWSAFVFMAHLALLPSSFVRIQLPGMPAHNLSWATLWLLGYTIFYVAVDWRGGLLYLFVLYAMYASAVRLHHHDQNEEQLQQQASKQSTQPPSWTGTGRLLRRALVLHLLGWYMQIHPGHRLLEGAQPAIAQSLGGALTSAPLFAFYEGVWFLGYRLPFQHRVLQRVDELSSILCDQGVVLQGCPGSSERTSSTLPKPLLPDQGESQEL